MPTDRPAGPHHRRAGVARPRSGREGDHSCAPRHGRRPDHDALHHRSPARCRQIGPQDLTIDALVSRAHDPAVKKIILALPATVDGQTTTHYITDLLHDADRSARRTSPSTRWCRAPTIRP